MNLDNPPPSLGLPREELPQIKDLDAFLSRMDRDGIKYERKTVSSALLTGTQQDFDADKVDDILDNGINKPVIVSMDYQIMDGHHRWAAALMANEDLEVIVVDLSIQDLIYVAGRPHQ